MISRQPRRRGSAVLIALCCALGSASLTGCGSMSEKFSQVAAEAPVVGLPAGVPERRVTPAAYPAVHAMPPARPAALTPAEQMKLEDEMMAARNNQQALAGQPISPPPASYAPAAAAPAKTVAANTAAPALKAASKKKTPPAAAQTAPAAPSSSNRTIY
jgi:hypothetical protein